MKKISTILSPLFLGVFLLPIFAHAEEASSSAPTDEATTSALIFTKAQLFTGCSQDAIELRDTKLAQSRSVYNNAMNAILLDRKNAEKAAIAIEGEKEKKVAVKESVETYKAKVKTIQNTLTQSRKNIWQNFENDTKKCRVFLEKDDDSATALDEQPAKEIKKDASDVKEIKKEDKKEVEQKTVKESIFDSIKSLFGKEN